MLQTKDKIIEKRTYSVTQFPARHGFVLKARLAKLIGPAVAELFAALKGGSAESVMSADVDMSMIGGAIHKLLDGIDGEDALDLVLKLLSMTRLDGKEISEQVFDMEFAGRFSELYKVLAFVVEVNYGDFFGSNGIGRLAAGKLSAI